MPVIKDLLRGPIEIPRSIEANLPAGLPKLSTILESIRAGLPAGPELPAAGGLPTALPTPQAPKITEFIKSIEANLPAGLPKISEAATQLPGQSQYREIEIKKEAAGVAAVREGGYRGIT